MRLWDIEKEPSQGNNDNLDQLLNNGCKWLDDYFKTNPGDSTNPNDANVGRVDGSNNAPRNVKEYCDSLKKSDS